MQYKVPSRAVSHAVLVSALALLVVPLAGFANAIVSNRLALHPHEAVATTGQQGRVCWARYTANRGQTRNGMLEEVAFRVPCPEQMTPELIRSLQRALAIRGYFNGPVTGRTDDKTRMAVQAFQRDAGFDSSVLTLETAQRLGLLPIGTAWMDVEVGSGRSRQD